MSTPILRARRSASGSRKRASGHSVCLQGPKPGGTAYSARIAVLRRKNRRVRFLAENVFLQAGRNILVETRNLRSAPAHHNYIGIQQIDDLRQTAREAVFEPIEGGKRGRFPGVASREDLGTLESNTCRAMVVRFEAGSGNPRFDAAIPSAIASETGILLGAHPWQSVVAPFARDSIRTAVQTAIDGDSPAAASAQYDCENDVLARAGAVSCFRNRQAVGVIRASHFARHRATKVFVERLAVQPGGIGVLHQTSPRRNGPGDSHAHGGAPSKFLLDSFDGFCYGAHRSFIVETRRGYAVAVQFLAVALQGHEFNLRAAEIHANSNELLFFLSGRHG